MNIWIEEVKSYDLNGVLSSTNYFILFKRPKNFLGFKWMSKRYVKKESCNIKGGPTYQKQFKSIEDAEIFIHNDFNPLKIKKTEYKIIRSIDKSYSIN